MYIPSKLFSLDIGLCYSFNSVTFLFHHEHRCCYIIVCSIFNSCVIFWFKPMLFGIFEPLQFFTIIHGHAIWILVIEYLYTFLRFSLDKFPEVVLLNFPENCRIWWNFSSWGVLKTFYSYFQVWVWEVCKNEGAF